MQGFLCVCWWFHASGAHHISMHSCFVSFRCPAMDSSTLLRRSDFVVHNIVFIYFWHLWTLNKTYIYCFLQFRLIGYSLTIVFPSLSHRFIFMYPVYFYGSCIYKTKACNIKSQKDLFNQIIHSTRIPSSFGKIFPQYFLS